MAARDAFEKVEPATRRGRRLTTAPGPDSAAIWRAKSTSSTPRGRPSRPRNRRPRQQGIDWSRFLVGYDGITLVVNPKNDFVKSLSVEQFKNIWATSEQGEDLERHRSGLARPRDHSSIRRTTIRERSSSSPKRSSARPKSQRDDVQIEPRRQYPGHGSRAAIPTRWAISATPITRPTKTTCGRGRSERTRAHGPCFPARRRSSTRPTLRFRGRCISTSKNSAARRPEVGRVPQVLS